MANVWEKRALEEAVKAYHRATYRATEAQTPRQMQGMSATELAVWSIEHGWAPAETKVEYEQALTAARQQQWLEWLRRRQQKAYDDVNKAVGSKKEGVMEEQWWKPQTASAGVRAGCHLCGAKTVRRDTREVLKHKKVDGEKIWCWETKITKTFECGTVASQTDEAQGRTAVKVGKGCLDISALQAEVDVKEEAE